MSGYVSAPFQEGFTAGLNGDDPSSCPYDKLTREWSDWNRARNLVIEMAGALEIADDEDDE
jgi:ribosome modulation factor